MRVFNCSGWSCVLLFIATFSVIISCTEDILYDKSYWLPEVQNFLDGKDTSALHIMFISDWGYNGSENQQAVADEMAFVSKTSGLDFILTCGDNFQVAGVKNTGDQLWQTNYEQVYDDSSLMVSWYPSLGNHDYLGMYQAQVEYSSVNPYWNMPSLYYTFVKEIDSVDAIRFIVMDTQGLLSEFDILSDSEDYTTIPQFVWLEEVLENCREKWIIVTGHHPVYSSGANHGDTQVMKVFIKPLFEEYGVDFYICGHDHDFEHAYEEGERTNYIVTGTGGEVRPVGSNSRTVFSLSSLGFTYVTVTSSLLKLYFITSEGRIAYNYVVNK